MKNKTAEEAYYEEKAKMLKRKLTKKQGRNKKIKNQKKIQKNRRNR
jgi:hypothetical protein